MIVFPAYAQDAPLVQLESATTMGSELRLFESNSKWAKCIAVLETLLHSFPSDESEPNATAIHAALDIIQSARKRRDEPPAKISREPSGGIIIDFEPQHSSSLFEWTCYNDGSLEFAHYEHGDVVNMVSYPPCDADCQDLVYRLHRLGAAQKQSMADAW